MVEPSGWAGRAAAFIHEEDFGETLNREELAERFCRWLELRMGPAPMDVVELESRCKGVQSRLRQMVASRRSDVPSAVAVADDLELLKLCPEYLDCYMPVLHEDDSYVAVDKPWDYRLDLKTEDQRSYAGEPVISEWLKPRTGDGVVRFCHQLDYSTSGVLLMAKDRNSCSAVGKRFVRREVDKYYVAILLGALDLSACPFAARLEDGERLPDNDAWVEEALRRILPPETASQVPESLLGAWYAVEIHISQEGSGMRHDVNNGKACETAVRVIHRATTAGWLHRAGSDQNAPVPMPLTFVLFKPLTGRRHQLRMTAEQLGCPILGDLRYGTTVGSASNAERIHRNSYRMYLHALALKLKTPRGPIHLISTRNCFNAREECFDSSSCSENAK